MSEPVTPYLEHLLPRRGFWKHFWQLATMTVIFLAVSAVALGYALGYEVNWPARTLQRTGGIYVNIRNNIPASIYLNGQVQAANRPLTVSHLFPGQYDLVIKSEGYRSFTEIVQVDANTVSALHNLVLIRTTPERADVDPGWLPLLAADQDARVQIKNQSEIWVNQLFVTRTSQNIIQANYYPDNRHLVYQEGGSIWMLDLENQTTELLLDGIGSAPLLYNFENGGQVLLYQKQGAVPAALTLY